MKESSVLSFSNFFFLLDVYRTQHAPTNRLFDSYTKFGLVFSLSIQIRQKKLFHSIESDALQKKSNSYCHNFFSSCYSMFSYWMQSKYTYTISKNYHMNRFVHLYIRIKIVNFLLFYIYCKLKSNTRTNCMTTAQKCCCKCIERNLAHLQAHEVSEASESWTCSNAPTKIPIGNLCVSQQQNFIERNEMKILFFIFWIFFRSFFFFH